MSYTCTKFYLLRYEICNGRAYPWPSTPTQCVEENTISTLRLRSSSSSNYRGLPNIPMSTPGSREGICSRMGRMWSRTMCLSRMSSICPMETRHLMRSCKGEEKNWSWDLVRREGGTSRSVSERTASKDNRIFISTHLSESARQPLVSSSRWFGCQGSGSY